MAAGPCAGGRGLELVDTVGGWGLLLLWQPGGNWGLGRETESKRACSGRGSRLLW